ncbi:hypothetical protein [Mycoplasma wenyonii]|nr:hypothetical protein [Mycoplasma wenyonii]
MWIGNEVFCGTGMQRIDLLIKQENEDFIFIKIIELKDDKIQLDWVQQQLSWYIKWVLWYIVPSYLSSTKKKIIVIPCIIVPSVKSSQYYELAQEEIVCLEDRVEISKLEVVLFHSLNDLLSFRKVIFN